jgi:starvation-inducible DNA-binding protein
MSNHPLLPPTRLAIPPEIRVYVITILNQTLACTLDLRSHVKHAGWNVKGPDAAQLQALFALLAVELEAYTDLLAERIVVLGGTVRGTARMVATHSTLREYPSDLVEGPAHVCALAERVASYVRALRSDIGHATDVEEMPTAAVYTDIARGAEKRLAGLEAYLHQGRPGTIGA